MRRHARPIVFASRCLGFEACRYDGDIVANDFLPRLARFAEVVRVCPEVEIGLGTPRAEIRIVAAAGPHRLVQPATGRDLTLAMRNHARRRVAEIEVADGFVLKSRSPSCGLTDTKLHAGEEGDGTVGFGAGFFARAVLARFPDLPVTDETRLEDPSRRATFLARIFRSAARRQDLPDDVPEELLA